MLGWQFIEVGVWCGVNAISRCLSLGKIAISVGFCLLCSFVPLLPTCAIIVHVYQLHVYYVLQLTPFVLFIV